MSDKKVGVSVIRIVRRGGEVTSKERLTWHLYKPSGWQASVGHTARADLCRHAVHEGLRGVGFHQCQRKPKVVVDGYGLCTLHAKKAQGKAG